MIGYEESHFKTSTYSKKTLTYLCSLNPLVDSLQSQNQFDRTNPSIHPSNACYGSPASKHKPDIIDAQTTHPYNISPNNPLSNKVGFANSQQRQTPGYTPPGQFPNTQRQTRLGNYNNAIAPTLHMIQPTHQFAQSANQSLHSQHSLAQSQHSLAQSQHSAYTLYGTDFRAQQPTMHTPHNLNSSQTHHAYNTQYFNLLYLFNLLNLFK